MKYLMNITDIDDKIIDRARENGVSCKELAEKYEKSFYEDMRSLRADGVDKFARATDYIKQIVGQVRTLLDKGYAYKIEGDGYYFDLSKAPDYGKLAHRTALGAEDAVSRIDESVNKKNKGDFALWKFSKADEPAWDTKLGKGRPGWHIEDTAITDYHFGPQYDVHGGAVDLIFPHHEAEIAQQESASGKKPFVKYWLHTGFLTVNGQKMSKSLGNFITIKDLLGNYSPEAIRMMALSAHYRSPLDFSESAIKQSQAAVQRIGEFSEKLRLAGGSAEADNIIEEAGKKFEEAMDDDLNTARAIAAIFDLIRNINPLLTDNSLSNKSAEKAASLLKKFDSVLGIIPSGKEKVPAEVMELVQEREEMRRNKDWAGADTLREKISALGYKVDDTSYGPLVSKK